MKKRANEYIKM